MKKSHKILAKIALALTLTSVSLYLFSPWEFALFYLRPLPETVQAQADEATGAGIDGILIYVQQGDAPGQTYASGWHDRAAQTPLEPTAYFKIASIAKLYVASAVAKLVASGDLALDQTLAHYMPHLQDRIEYADRITLRMLVQHRSGIPNFTDADGFDWGSDGGLAGGDALDLVLDKPADFAPDTDYAYSNTNYLLLERIMDAVLGYGHWRYFEEKLLAPLGLEHTFPSVASVEPAEIMGAYHVGYEQNFNALNQGYVATIQDVGRFLRAMNTGALFTLEEREIYASIYKFNHEGWVLGHSSRAYYHPDIDSVIIQFVGTTGNDTVILTGIVYDRVVQIVRSVGALATLPGAAAY